MLISVKWLGHLTVFMYFLFSAEREAEVLYEVLFDEEFAGGLNIR